MVIFICIYYVRLKCLTVCIINNNKNMIDEFSFNTEMNLSWPNKFHKYIRKSRPAHSHACELLMFVV